MKNDNLKHFLGIQINLSMATLLPKIEYPSTDNSWGYLSSLIKKNNCLEKNSVKNLLTFYYSAAPAELF